MGIIDKAKDALGGDDGEDTNDATGQQYAEQVEGLAGSGDTGTPPEDEGPVVPQGLGDPMTPGQSPADAVRSPITEPNP